MIMTIVMYYIFAKESIALQVELHQSPLTYMGKLKVRLRMTKKSSQSKIQKGSIKQMRNELRDAENATIEAYIIRAIQSL